MSRNEAVNRPPHQQIVRKAHMVACGGAVEQRLLGAAAATRSGLDAINTHFSRYPAVNQPQLKIAPEGLDAYIELHTPTHYYYYYFGSSYQVFPNYTELMLTFDADGDGKLSFEEILEDMEVVSKSEYAELRKTFDLYDEDGDGFLSLKELEGFLIHSEDNWIEVEEKPENWWSKDSI